MGYEMSYDTTNDDIRSFDYSAARFPMIGVGSSRLALTPVFQATLSSGEMSDRLHSFRSLITHSFHVFLGLPRPLRPATSISVIVFMHAEERCTCPNHLSRRARSTEVTSSIPNFASRTSEGVSSCGFVPQIHRIIARSLRRSRCRSDPFGAHASLPWSMANRTQAANNLPRVLKETCLDVRMGKSFLTFPRLRHIW